ncbi:MAG: methyltransferase domain-containing protein [Acidocella sp.]|nr:methyltransferase domain-containing protein [Acidocella sp.]
MSEVNAAQISYWNEVAGPKWVRIGDEMDARFVRITEALMAQASPQPGARVLDIGAGTGATAWPLARAVGAGGMVTGIDISAPMLGVARARGAGHPNVSFLEADAQIHDFGAQRFDLLCSRFGVMFFGDPVAAFANLRRAMAPAGRLCFACWAPLAANPHWAIPFEIVVAALGPPAPRHPHAPGPMAFSDPDYVTGILQAAGFTHIAVTPTNIPIIGRSVAEEARIAGVLGPSGALLDEKQADADMRAAMQTQFATALSAFAQADGSVASPACVHIVTARPQ